MYHIQQVYGFFINIRHIPRTYVASQYLMARRLRGLEAEAAKQANAISIMVGKTHGLSVQEICDNLQINRYHYYQCLREAGIPIDPNNCVHNVTLARNARVPPKQPRIVTPAQMAARAAAADSTKQHGRFQKGYNSTDDSAQINESASTNMAGNAKNDTQRQNGTPKYTGRHDLAAASANIRPEPIHDVDYDAIYEESIQFEQDLQQRRVFGETKINNPGKITGSSNSTEPAYRLASLAELEATLGKQMDLELDHKLPPGPDRY